MSRCRYALPATWGFILAASLCASTASLWAAEQTPKPAASRTGAVEGKTVKAAAEAVDQRFGLSEERRKQVFRECLGAEKRAEREAGERYADHPGSAEHDQLMDRLSEKYKGEVARKYGLTPKQLVELEAEGFARGWPMLAPPTQPESGEQP